jgi:uncharacterized protein YneR
MNSVKKSFLELRKKNGNTIKESTVCIGYLLIQKLKGVCVVMIVQDEMRFKSLMDLVIFFLQDINIWEYKDTGLSLHFCTLVN